LRRPGRAAGGRPLRRLQALTRRPAHAFPFSSCPTHPSVSPPPPPHLLASPPQLLGPEANNPNADVSSLPLEPPRDGSPPSRRLCALLAALRAGRAAAQPAFAVRQGTPAEAVAMPLLVEDRTSGQMGYADFLLAVHKAVMAK
jgi:hypothetical protein